MNVLGITFGTLTGSGGAATKPIALPDGRSLAYREYGDPGGRVVLNCHGGILCGRDAEPFGEAARALGLRIVSPDRPGIGRSSPAPGRTTASWATDARALLDALGAEHASVVGWSMGGQYALACAALLPDRIDRAAIIAGALPIDGDATFAQLNKMDRRLTDLARRRPRAARAAFRMLGTIARHAPKLWQRQMARDAAGAEAAALRALPDPGFASAAADALERGDGMVEEYLAWARPWGFRPEDVAIPTTIWQGDADTLIPPQWGEELARRIPNAQLRKCSGEGHFLGLRHQHDILGDLLDAPR